MRLPAALALTLALSGASGCKRSQPPVDARPEPPIPALGTIAVQDLTPEQAGGVHLDTRALEQRTRDALAGSGLFAGRAGDGGAGVVARVRAEVALEDVAAGQRAAARAVLRLRIDTRPSGQAPSRWNEDVQAGAEAPYNPGEKPDRAALFQKLVTRTLDDLLGAYLARQKLWAGDPGTVHAAIKGDAGELRLEAIRLVGEKRIASEVPTLLELLSDPDEGLRDAALGALVEMREKRAVGVLAGQRSMRDRREMRKILDAIALLGGDEAADYLAFVADGHDDPEIRQMAADARRRLLRRNGVDAAP